MQFRFLLALLVTLLGALAFTQATGHAQDWPNRPVQIVVSSGAGGAADIVARMIAEKLSPAIGQPVVIENRTGAGGHVGAAAVARANPDGYTLLMSGSPTHSVGPHLFKNLPYEPMRDVPPVAMVGVAHNLLVVNAASPVRSVADLVQLARDKPGTVTYSSAGIGTSGYLAAELLKHTARLDMSHVPYKSGPEAVTGVLTGSVSFLFFTLPSVLPQIESGKLRALAIASATRSALVPNVPTIVEAGYKDFDVIAWYALFAPRGTPEPIVSRLSAEVEKIVARDDVRGQMAKLGAEPRYLSPKALTDFVAIESPKWGELLKDIKAPVN
jgi:tripartite-type tricarboxylate transporter receptor subunit TctC